MTGQNPPGRPTALTPAVRDQLRAMVRGGVTLEAAATAAGVSPRSVRRWRARDQLNLDQALAEAELALVVAVGRVCAAVVARGGVDARA